jgi:hypothetical protein
VHGSRPVPASALTGARGAGMTLVGGSRDAQTAPDGYWERPITRDTSAIHVEWKTL